MATGALHLSSSSRNGTKNFEMVKSGKQREKGAARAEPQGTAEGHYTPTDHKRSKDMDDISPDRIPT